MSEVRSSPPIPAATTAVLLAVRQAADILCDRWTMAIVLYGFAGATRFSEFKAHTGMASRQLTQRLRALENHGILIRMPYSRRPLRHGSHLTTMGLALFDVIACMVGWEQRHGNNRNAPAVRLSHQDCGDDQVSPELCCVHCKSPLSAHEVSGLDYTSREVTPLPPKKAAYRRAAISRGVSTDKLPLPECMAIVGDKWTIEFLVIVFLRISNFVEMQSVSGASSNILSDRLTRLLRLGLLRQTTADEEGRTGSYRITEKGIAFYPVLLALQAWADEWLPDRLRSPLPLRHRPCGHTLQLAAACNTCGEVITAEEIDFRVVK